MTTYEVIQHQEVGAGGAASITFSSIPQTYTDLVVLVSARGDGAFRTAAGRLLPNATGSNLSMRWLRGSGSAASSSSSTSTNGIYLGEFPSATATSNTFSNLQVTIPNYTSSQNKSFSVDAVQEDNQTEAYQHINAGLWSSASAITSLVVDIDSGNFVQYSSATLIGITAGSDGITSVS